MFPQPSEKLASRCTSAYGFLKTVPGTVIRDSVAEIRLPEDSSFIFHDAEGNALPLLGLHFSMDHREAFPIVRNGIYERELFYGEYTEEEIIRSCEEIEKHYGIINFRNQ